MFSVCRLRQGVHLNPQFIGDIRNDILKVNGSQLAKMKKSIPDMSLPKNL